MFDLQDSPSHKKFEDTMIEGEEHQNTKEPIST